MAFPPMAVRNRVDSLFQRCAQEKRSALVLYLTSGFPDAATTRRLLPVLAKSGCDLIELGVPFSDPIADGPIIQRSSTVALGAGMTLPITLDILKEFRAGHDTPVILFGALNPYLARGLEHSADLAADAGADGILAADLPHEEAAEFSAILRERGLHLITLVAPTTPDDRFATIAADSTGFLYCIAMKGTTGQLSGVTAASAGYLARLRRNTNLPLALGFGISKPEHVRAAVEAGADGVVVGSSLITLVEETIARKGDLDGVVSDYVRGLASELKRR